MRGLSLQEAGSCNEACDGALVLGSCGDLKAVAGEAIPSHQASSFGGVTR